MSTMYSIGELATLLGVAVGTLRRWDKAGKLTPSWRTIGGHRRYDVAQAQALRGGSSTSPQRTVAYARVSSKDQKPHLATQAQRLEQYCAAQGWQDVLTLQDLGSGMNDKKPRLLKLMRLLLSGEVERRILVTKDRLLRFGAELIFQL